MPNTTEENHESTMVDVLEAYAQGGFGSSFVVTDDSRLECVECGAVSPPATDVLQGLRDERSDTTAPGNSAHGETTGDDTPREGRDASRSAS